MCDMVLILFMRYILTSYGLLLHVAKNAMSAENKRNIKKSLYKKQIRQFRYQLIAHAIKHLKCI